MDYFDVIRMCLDDLQLAYEGSGACVRLGQTGDQRLKTIAGHIEQALARPWFLRLAHAVAASASILIFQLGHLGAGHFGCAPRQVALEKLLNGLAQLRHDHVRQLQLLPQRQQFGQTKAKRVAKPW